MKRIAVLCRHGNTFNKGEKVVMVGAREDLPLTAQGEDQGRAVGQAFKRCGVAPTFIASGPLLRTRVFAERLKDESGSSCGVEIENRLVEFDYGSWSGLSNEEIVALHGMDALIAWQERGERPSDTCFSPSSEVARADAQTLLADLSLCAGLSVVVTSNGRLREFGALLSPPQNIASAPYKVRTGGSCVLVLSGNRWEVRGWDLPASELEACIRSVS